MKKFDASKLRPEFFSRPWMTRGMAFCTLLMWPVTWALLTVGGALRGEWPWFIAQGRELAAMVFLPWELPLKPLARGAGVGPECPRDE